MKRVLSWIVVTIIMILISVLLFVTGKQHKVLLINGEKGVEVPARVSYIVDGENSKKPKSIRANKKGVVYVKGINHEIVIKFKDADGTNKEISKKFKAKLSQMATIDFAGIINGTDDWITYKEIQSDNEEE